MTRLIKKTAKAPQKVCDQWICMCGLSKNQPFCDGSHKKTLDEADDQIYVYTKKGERKEVHFEDQSQHHH